MVDGWMVGGLKIDGQLLIWLLKRKGVTCTSYVSCNKNTQIQLAVYRTKPPKLTSSPSED